MAATKKSSDYEYKQAIIIRTDLLMGKGKTAAQAAHAAVTAADKSPYKTEWMREGQKKIVLKAASEAELLNLHQEAQRAGLPTAIINDAGPTQITHGTTTCIAIGPAPDKDVDAITS